MRKERLSFAQDGRRPKIAWFNETQNPFMQIAKRKRLTQKSAGHVMLHEFRRAGRDKQYLGSRQDFLEFFPQLDAVHARHREIGDNNIEITFRIFDNLESVFAASGRGDIVTGIGQKSMNVLE